MVDFNKLTSFKLTAGAHPDLRDGMCVMEAVSWFEGEPHSDEPVSVCPAIRSIAMCVNDSGESLRKRLVPYIPRFVGTASNDPELAHTEFSDRATYFVGQVLSCIVPLAFARLPVQDGPISRSAIEFIKRGEFRGHTILWWLIRKHFASVFSAAPDPHGDRGRFLCWNSCFNVAARIMDMRDYPERRFWYALWIFRHALTERLTMSEDLAFGILDGMLAIGQQSRLFSHDPRARLAELETKKVPYLALA